MPPRHSASNVVEFPHGPNGNGVLLRAILDSMSHGVVALNDKDEAVFANERYREMFGISREIVPGISISELLKDSLAAIEPGALDRYYACLRTNGPGAESFFQLANGRTYSIVVKQLPEIGRVATHEDVTERRQSEQQVAHMAHHDPLTDLPNRTLLRGRLEHELKRVRRGESIAVLALDLDYFKTINDTLGHPIGDQLLKLVADRLRSCTRDPDTVARLGGDEFAIIMTQLHKPLDATILARRIRESVSRPFHVDGHQIVTDISIGISVAPDDGTEPDVLLKNADMALYGAKEDGRGTWRFFEAEMDTKMRARRDLEMSLRSALANGEFNLHYQPLVTLGSNEVAGFEALIRWNRSGNRMVSPGDFIPIAEETGLIVPIGEWVLRTACQEAAKWPSHIKVAVNISPSQLSNRNIVATVSSALAAAQLAPERLQLEITETVLLQNTFSTLARLHQLHELGIQIALDDFGTGYSSLSYLRSFPFDKIKIGRSFIKDLGAGEEPFAIVKAVAGLAKGLKIASTAEGVETTSQLEILQGIGCTEIQGSLFSRPLPAEDVSKVLTHSLEKSAAG